MYFKKGKIYPAYVSKYNSNREKQVIFLIIPNGERREAKSKTRWHYLAVKQLSALLRITTSKNDVGFYYLNVFIPLEQKTNLNRIKMYVKIKIFKM